jgi:hypothetical protein
LAKHILILIRVLNLATGLCIVPSYLKDVCVLFVTDVDSLSDSSQQH